MDISIYGIHVYGLEGHGKVTCFEMFISNDDGKDGKCRGEKMEGGKAWPQVVGRLVLACKQTRP